MKTLILVDFDKTLYKKDSLLEFTKFYQGNFKFYFGFLVLLPVLILMKIGLIKNEKAKEFFLTYFFKDEDSTFFQKMGTNFADTKIQENIDLNLYKKIKELKSKNATLFIVTASCNEWIKSWSTKNDFKIISTEIEVIDNKITGKLQSKNCNGIEKVNRIKKEINVTDFDEILVFGNGKGDLEMLKLTKQMIS